VLFLPPPAGMRLCSPAWSRAFPCGCCEPGSSPVAAVGCRWPLQGHRAGRPEAGCWV